MLVANRPVSIGPFHLQAGDKVTREMQLELPPGRLPVLIEHRIIEEIVDEVADTRLVDDLAFRVEKLERTVAQLTATVTRQAKAKAPTEKEG